MSRSRRNIPSRHPAFFAGTAALLLAGCITVAASDAVKAQPAMAAATGAMPAQAVAAFAPGPETYARLKTPAGRTAFVQTYCVGCHNARAKTAGLVLEGLATDQLPEHAVIWEKVIKRLGAGEMPPRNAPRRPDMAVSKAMVAELIEGLDFGAARNPHVGHTVIRRLNRLEYGNAVRDLLNVDFPYSAELPQDGGAEGFDNIADALSISPVLLDSYLKVARKVSNLALGHADPSPITEQFFATKSQAAWQEGMPFGTRGGVLVKKYFPRDGEYDLRAFLLPANLSPLEGVRFFHARVPVNTGQHTFIVTFPQARAQAEGPVPDLPGLGGLSSGGPLDAHGSAVHPKILFLLDGKVFRQFDVGAPSASEAALGAAAGPPILGRAEITGPYNVGPPADTASRRHVLVCAPKTSAQEGPCANRILSTLLRRAWRRDVSARDVQPFTADFRKSRASGDDFPSAIAVALRDILVSPAFLFRLEFDPAGAKPGQAFAVNDFELASRLSFFLWSAAPDDALLNLASHRQLRNRAVLDGQVKRMLADQKSNALVDNFAGQWLGIRNSDHDLEGFTPDAAAYGAYDNALGDAFVTEARLFLQSVMRENRSVMDVLTANYSFLNERLADNYGIEGVKGPGFRRVTFPAGSPRGGILGMGAFLMPNSHPATTSPVYRGKWILTYLMNSPPSPPPPGVPPLNAAPQNGKVLTIREQMERHRANPICATCHSRMDPYGFSLENFDVMGRWRDADSGTAIDARADLVSGLTFTGPAGLKQNLAASPDVFVGATVARMMTYALGRPLDALDQPTVRQIVNQTKAGNYRVADIVLGIVHSAPFQKKQVEQEQP
jgi:mono/diheme cytochrome c family protein